MRLHLDFVARVGARGGAQDQVEGVVGVHGEPGDLGGVHLQRLGDRARLVVVAVQRQADQVGRRELDGVPLEHDGGLGCVAAAQGRGRGQGGAEAIVDLVLQGLEALLGGGLGGEVAADGDVDDGAGGDVWWEEDGRELDLWASLVSHWVCIYRCSTLYGSPLAAAVMLQPCLFFCLFCLCLYSGETHKSFIWGEEDCDAGVDLADSQGDKHLVQVSPLLSGFLICN